jgi:hypothetical protein
LEIEKTPAQALDLRRKRMMMIIFWNRGDETTPALMRRAMETFSMK